MNVNFRMLIFWTTIVLCLTQTTAWWWRSSDPPQDQSQWPLPPAVYYQQRLLKTHQVPLPSNPQFAPPPGEPTMAVPAIPIQVPLHAQLAPIPNVQNVQLVPCLCPVNPEEFDKQVEQPYNKKEV